MSSPANSNSKPFLWMRCPSPGDAEVFTYNYVYKYNGKVFDILLSPNTPPGFDAASSIESRFLQRLEAANSCEGDDDEVVAKMMDDADRLSAEIQIHVIKVSQSMMQDLAPETQDLSPIKLLRSYM